MVLSAPTAAHAAVVINEVAWMGTSVSANAEWIELYNNGSTVDLTGWTITSSTGAPSITLTGSIGASGYMLLERTSDASVPDIAADTIYSGALANTGSTLYLKDATGAVIDTVEGGTDWKLIGGDNTSKQTAQRTGSGWGTGAPTPRAVNAASGSGSTGAASSTDSLTPQPSVNGSPVVPTANTNPIARLYIDPGPGRIVVTGAVVPFSAQIFDSEGAIRRDVDLLWNFGDGTSLQGDAVNHTYIIPGTYTVTIAARSGYAHAVTLLRVRVDEPHVHISYQDAERIDIENTGTELIDMSEWMVTDQTHTVTLPAYTVLLPSTRLSIPRRTTVLASSTDALSLVAPDGRTVATCAYSTGTRTEASEVRAVVQPEGQVLGLQTVEEAAPQIVITPPVVYADATTAPDAPVKPAASGALVHPIRPLLASPWTASFLGLLLAAGAALVIL